MADDVTQMYVGSRTRADGSLERLRGSRNCSLVVGQGQGKYYEQASRGEIYSLVLTAWSSTIAAGNINAAATGASTQFALWNLASSPVNLALLKFQVWPISGTAPIPPVFHSMSITAPTIAHSVVTPVTNNKTGASGACQARALTSAAGSNLTGSTALQIIRAASFTITAGAMGTTGGFGNILTEYVDGDIVISPGTAWVPTWIAAGTTFLGGYSVTWAEIPI